jgi:hypothetical protein
VGDATFFKILKAWTAERAGGNGNSQDFATLAGRVAQRDLSGFFNAWVFSLGKPRARPALRLRTVTAPGGRQCFPAICPTGGLLDTDHLRRPGPAWPTWTGRATDPRGDQSRDGGCQSAKRTIVRRASRGGMRRMAALRAVTATGLDSCWPRRPAAREAFATRWLRGRRARS